MKVLVLGGCGAMGTESTRDLAETSDFDEIMIADADLGRAQTLADRLGGGRVRAMTVDVTNVEQLTKVFGGYDVVVNCTSYAFGLGITQAAIAARRSLLDLGGLYNTPKQLALTDEAKAANMTVVLGMGATPGVTNLMARDGANTLDRVDEIHVTFATYRPIAPSPGLLSTVLDEFSPSTKRFYYEAGKHVEARPFEGARKVTFEPPIGEVTAWFVPHSEIHTLPRFIEGVQRVYVRGTWRKEIMDALLNYNDVGLLSTEPLEVAGQRVVPKDLLTHVFLNNPTWPDDLQWAFYVNVEVHGEKNGAPHSITYNLSHPPPEQWGKSATARVTGIPASIAAQLIAKRSDLPKGVLAPEAVFEPRPFFEELAKRQTFVHRRESEAKK